MRHRRTGSRRAARPRLRVGLGVTVLAGLAGYVLVSSLHQAAAVRPWFGGYVDVTITPHHDFRAAEGPGRNVVLAFAVADPDEPCRPKWGSAYSAGEAAERGLDRQIADLRENGGQIALSFGGALNHELATVCQDDERLAEAYRRAVDRYGVQTIDLDIEEQNLPDAAAGERRARAMAVLQAEHAADGAPLDIWLTLPASPTGLTPDGTRLVQQMLDAGVDLAGVNIMTMNYGASRPQGMGMLEASIQSAQVTHSQLNGLYRKAGQNLDTEQVWQRIGLTPMIGQNDVETDVFGLEDARALNAFARAHGVGRVSMWSLNRDRPCDPGDAPSAAASPLCSGVNQHGTGFAELLGEGFSGRIP